MFLTSLMSLGFVIASGLSCDPDHDDEILVERITMATIHSND